MLLRTVARLHKLDLKRPWRELDPAEQALLARGAGARPLYKVKLERSTTNAEIEEEFSAAWPGLCGHVDAWHAKTEDPEWAAVLETAMEKRTCSTCKGERLTPASAAVTVGKLRLPELLTRSVDEALAWAGELDAKRGLPEGVEPVVHEVRSRLALLARVGLGYLTLERTTSTLSGGEARRVRLASSLGSQLVGVCYVLDEPTVGLHPQDVERLTDALCELRDLGNTLLVVEHDTALMRRADWIVDLGPGAGRQGGEIVASAPPPEVARHATSLTAAALRGEIRLERSASAARTRTPDKVKLTGARLHNLKGVDFEFAFGEITGVCGPSGSGKSTLILDTLVPALWDESSEGRWKRLSGLPGGGARLVVVDAAPIGRTPASIPATYAGVMEPLRELFARTPDAKRKGFDAGRFSFNSPKGRCPACEGKGATQVEMQFLADLWLACEECDGKRYAPEVLEVRFRGKSIADVLSMTVDEALEFLAHQPQIVTILESLREVGLGYLQLGQSSTTLSGGEAQRVKLASELYRAGTTARSVIVLDEPSTGLRSQRRRAPGARARPPGGAGRRRDPDRAPRRPARDLRPAGRDRAGRRRGRRAAGGAGARRRARAQRELDHGPLPVPGAETARGQASTRRAEPPSPGGARVMRPDNPLIVQSDRSLMLHTVTAVVDGQGRPLKDAQGRRARPSTRASRRRATSWRCSPSSRRAPTTCTATASRRSRSGTRPPWA
jgi:excinuclease ABC subunit A